MLIRKKESIDIEQFWLDYEKSTGEKVLAKSLCQYVKGWAKYGYPLWGLAIATSGGFRFHHFAHEGWLMALTRISTSGDGPKEKTFFIPKDTIISVELVMEKSWWKKIFLSSNPALIIRCLVDGAETQVEIETDKSAIAIADALKV